MAYDFTGPWNPTVSGQHSSYDNAVRSINYWKNTVGISGSKLTLGVPFYGYDFTNSSNVTAFSYGQIVNLQASNSELDNVGLKFYNGRPTIKSKVKLASEQVMAYDFTGPWNPTVSGQHSSYDNAVRSINYWKNTIGISASKLTLGVPFYGYDFTNSSNVTAFSYGQMVNLQASNSELDNVGLKFYNGRPTIKSKVKLASEQVSGIMIWELGQDSFSEYSLLKTIHNEYKNLGFVTTELCLD